jgi:hypothetical protein
MPAYTIAQLEDVLGKYAESGALSFREMMSQLLPRIYRMGMWPDLAYEVSLSGQYGYISLPLDTAGVLACTVNDRPRPTRSLWHDVRISGRSASLSAYYGIVDEGYFPVLLDMKDVQGVVAEADVVAPLRLHLRLGDTSSGIAFSAFTGDIKVYFVDEDGVPSVLSLSEDGDSGEVYYEAPGEGIVRITSITYTDITAPFDLVDPDFPTKVIATIPAGSGVLRFRRFRTPEKSTSCTVHLLLKRDAPGYIDDNTVVHLGNIGAIKNAMLAIIDEDSADRARAKDSWAEVEKILDEELQAVMGSAKPTLKLDFGPCPPIQNMT